MDVDRLLSHLLILVESLYDQVFDQSFDLMISTAYKHISKRLLDTLMKQYHFMDHLTVSGLLFVI